MSGGRSANASGSESLFSHISKPVTTTTSDVSRALVASTSPEHAGDTMVANLLLKLDLILGDQDAVVAFVDSIAKKLRAGSLESRHITEILKTPAGQLFFHEVLGMARETESGRNVLESFETAMRRPGLV